LRFRKHLVNIYSDQYLDLFQIFQIGLKFEITRGPEISDNSVEGMQVRHTLDYSSELIKQTSFAAVRKKLRRHISAQSK
jgi:hypothetical protein